MLRSSVFVPLLLLGLSACDDLTPGSLIESTRILGARAELSSDPNRAWPQPGEEVTLSLVMAFPTELLPPISWGLLACPDFATNTALGGCAGQPLGLTLQETPIEEQAPSLTFTLPNEDTLDEITTIRLLGIVCTNSSVRLETDDLITGVPLNTITEVASCENEDERGIIFTATFPIDFADDDESNNHPALPSDFVVLALRGSDTPSTTDSCEGMSVDAIPSIPRTQTPLTLSLRVDPEARETFSVMRGDPPQSEDIQETLQISHFVTLGSLERQFSIIEDDDMLSTDLTWGPPPLEEIPDDGRLVRFYLVTRDLRAGLSSRSFVICVQRE